MNIVFALIAVAVVAWGFLPAIRALTDMCWPDEQRLVAEAWADAQVEIDRAEYAVKVSRDQVRARLGLHRF